VTYASAAVLYRRVDELGDYVMQSDDPVLLKWWAAYLESIERYGIRAVSLPLIPPAASCQCRFCVVLCVRFWGVGNANSRTLVRSFHMRDNVM
jgi:hypothetical protein